MWPVVEGFFMFFRGVLLGLEHVLHSFIFFSYGLSCPLALFSSYSCFNALAFYSYVTRITTLYKVELEYTKSIFENNIFVIYVQRY
jgi:hypothetical protein